MRRKNMIIYMISIIMLGLYGTGCAHTAIPDETVISESITDTVPEAPVDVDYILDTDEDQHFLVFSDISKLKGKTPSTTNLHFASVKEFYETVVHKKLTIEQKKFIANGFKKDEQNRIMICDFDNLHVPISPRGFTCLEVRWSGRIYSFSFADEDKIASAILRCLPIDMYTDIYREDYENAFDSKTINVTKMEQIDDKTIIHYKTDVAEMKRERYTLQDGSRTVMVDKQYMLSHSYDSVTVSETIPWNVKMYCEDGVNCYTVFLADPTESPTDEWLLSFGLEPYVPDEIS